MAGAFKTVSKRSGNYKKQEHELIRILKIKSGIPRLFLMPGPGKPNTVCSNRALLIVWAAYRFVNA